MIGRLAPAANVEPEMPGFIHQRVGDRLTAVGVELTRRGDGHGDEGLIVDDGTGQRLQFGRAAAVARLMRAPMPGD